MRSGCMTLGVSLRAWDLGGASRFFTIGFNKRLEKHISLFGFFISWNSSLSLWIMTILIMVVGIMFV